MTTLRLSYPPSSNRYWRVNQHTGRPYRTDEARAYIDETRWLCNIADVGMTDAPVSIRLQFMHDTGRRIDLDNGVKVLLDALQGHAYADDKQVVRLEAELILLPRKAEPYVIATVTPCTIRKVSLTEVS